MVITLTQLIADYNCGVYPEFLQIDIEGMDYDVLNSCDFTTTFPTVICVEADNRNSKKMDEMLTCKGFFPFHQTISNRIYLHSKVRDQYPLIPSLVHLDTVN